MSRAAKGWKRRRVIDPAVPRVSSVVRWNIAPRHSCRLPRLTTRRDHDGARGVRALATTAGPGLRLFSWRLEGGASDGAPPDLYNAFLNRRSALRHERHASRGRHRADNADQR